MAETATSPKIRQLEQEINRLKQQMEAQIEEFQGHLNLLCGIDEGRNYDLTWNDAASVSLTALETNNVSTMQVPVYPGLIVCAVMYVSTGAFRIQVRDNEKDENWIRQQTHIDCYAGTAQRPRYFPTRRGLLQNTKVELTLTNLTNAANTIYIVFACIWPYDKADIYKHGMRS